MIEEPIKYITYTPAQKKASQVYRLKNKDKINEQRKKYYQSRKESDPKFLEYKRMKAKEYYEKKKLEKALKVEEDIDISIEKLKDILIEEDKTDPIITPPTEDDVKTIAKESEPVEEVKQDKPKRQRKTKAPKV